MPTSSTSQMGADAHDATGFAANAGTFAGQGYKFVAQYIDQFADANTAGSPSLTHAQAQQENAAGLSIVSIFQTNGMSSSAGSGYQTYFTAAQGTSDATEAVNSAQAVGQPTGSAIYFAMDFDPAVFGVAGSEQHLLSEVQTYLTAVAPVLKAAGYTVGVYGAGDTLAAAIRNAPSLDGHPNPNYNANYTPAAQNGWLTQSYGWAGSNTMTNPPDTNSQGWDIYQSFQTTANNVAIDPDTATSASYGQWMCFGPGTAIRTARGEVAVEDLVVGDLAVTASGARRPITWIGQRTVECAREATPSEFWPVRICADAFAPGVPRRDLYLSPGHPVLVGAGEAETLVPIMCLINGTSIARAPRDAITYWHIELDEHDILLAEGLAAESYLEFGTRPWFENAAEHALLNPDFVVPGLEGRCRPVALAGALVDAERRRLDTLFARQLLAHCAWPSVEAAFAWSPAA